MVRTLQPGYRGAGYCFNTPHLENLNRSAPPQYIWKGSAVPAKNPRVCLQACTTWCNSNLAQHGAKCHPPGSLGLMEADTWNTTQRVGLTRGRKQNHTSCKRRTHFKISAVTMQDKGTRVKASPIGLWSLIGLEKTMYSQRAITTACRRATSSVAAPVPSETTLPNRCLNNVFSNASRSNRRLDP